jgi:hypothetical protein
MNEVSERLLDQRLRNRMMEEMSALAEWEETLEWGAGEYFNNFFDFFPDTPPLPDNSTLSEDEREALTCVLLLMAEAANSTPRHVTTPQLRTSGWPQRIAPAARTALELMRVRGCFSEELEEVEPSSGA